MFGTVVIALVYLHLSIYHLVVWGVFHDARSWGEGRYGANMAHFWHTEGIDKDEFEWL
jgi:hypothetical protein